MTTTIANRCLHGTPPYMVCPECQETRRQELREEALYATLDKLADAVNALARTAAEGEERKP